MENLTYLTAMLPPNENASFGLAKRLNAKGLQPIRKNEYSEDRIKNVIYGKTKDENIKPELISWLLEIHSPEELAAKIKQAQERVDSLLSDLLPELSPVDPASIHFFTKDENRPPKAKTPAELSLMVDANI